MSQPRGETTVQGSPAGRLFAVVPAAGHSRRMGRPKLLLELHGESVVARLLQALRGSGVTEQFVVVRPDDEPLREEVERCGATAVVPVEAPPDMRDSVQHALDTIGATCRPQAGDGWLLVPADHPVLSSAVLERLVEEWARTAAPVMVPVHAGRRGHPTFFRWPLASEVRDLPENVGLNHLVRAHADELVEVDVDDEAVLTDLDTPEDYDRLLERWQ